MLHVPPGPVVVVVVVAVAALDARIAAEERERVVIMTAEHPDNRLLNPLMHATIMLITEIAVSIPGFPRPAAMEYPSDCTGTGIGCEKTGGGTGGGACTAIAIGGAGGGIGACEGAPDAEDPDGGSDGCSLSIITFNPQVLDLEPVS